MSKFLFICLLVLVEYSSGEFSLERVFNKILDSDSNDECTKQVKHSSTLLARMLDASAKNIPSGISIGNWVNLGSFDECLSIVDLKEEIYGKYCLASVKLDQVNTMQETSKINHTLMLMQQTKMKLENFAESAVLDPNKKLLELSTLLRLGICLPNKCGSEFIQQYAPLEINEANCYTTLTNSKMDTSSIIAMVILYLFVLTALLSTGYDIFIEYNASKPIHPICIAFSFYTNGKKLFKSTRSSEHLLCLDGIKVFSMMWVILGHTYLNMLTSATVDNVVYIFKDWFNDPINMIVLSATVSVDTFFTVGGLLTVYVFMKSPPMGLKESFKKVPFLYLHRYLRLTPAFAVMILIYGSGLIRYIGIGPKWYLLDTTVENCANNWWAALTYIQNYKTYTNLCITQSWYLSVDFQIFLVTPFLLIPLKKWPKYVIPLLYTLAVVGMITPFCLGYSNKMTGIGLGSADDVFGQDYYFVTHTRFSPYVIGMIAGYYIYKLKKVGRPLILNVGTLLLLWILAIGGILFCIFDGYELNQHAKDNEWADGLYMGMNRSVWSASTALLILLCTTGNGEPLNKFLSLPIFQIISKLSYSMYLVHYIVILSVNASSRTPLHYNNFVIVFQFFSYFVITLGISMFFCLIFESPMITIERIIFPSPRKVEKQQKSTEEI